MAGNEMTAQSRSVSAGRDIVNSAIATGDNNKIQVQRDSLPASDTVDIQAELKAIQKILESLNHPITTGVAQELKKQAKQSEPDRDAVLIALETGLAYVKNLSGFAHALDDLRPHIQATIAWLGEQAYKLLPLIG